MIPLGPKFKTARDFKKYRCRQTQMITDATPPPSSDVDAYRDILDVIRMQHPNWYSTSKANGWRLLVVLFSGGHTGQKYMEQILSGAGVPVFSLHNMTEFQTKYCTYHRRDADQFTFRDMAAMFKTRYQRVIVLDIYREPVSRKMTSFFAQFLYNTRRYVWAKEALTADQVYERWDHTPFSEQKKIFERIIMNWIEQRDGIDTEYGTELQNYSRMHPFDHKQGFLLVPFSSVPHCFLVKVKYTDWQRWPAIMSYLLRVDAEHAAENMSAPEEAIPERNQALLQAFKQRYSPSLNVRAQLFHCNLFTRYMSASEQEAVVQQSVHPNTFPVTSKTLHTKDRKREASHVKMSPPSTPSS